MSAISLSDYTWNNKIYFDPKPIKRDGCPCKQIPFIRLSADDETRRKIIHDKAMLVFSYQQKYRLDLGPIHDELYLQSFKIQSCSNGASNILLTKLSFNCELTDHSQKRYQAYVHFDLRIPDSHTDEDAVFSYDLLEKAYGGKYYLYRTIESFYKDGKKIANSNNVTHGHTPDYSGTKSSHDQYILHTEQLLVAYLALPQAAHMLSNRLRSEIRATYPNAKVAKIYNMGIHMHSTKTCCAPCEYTLLGLTNFDSDQMLIDNGKLLGLLMNFTQKSMFPNELLNFQFSDQALKAFVTVSANNVDADHKKTPEHIQTPIEINQNSQPFIISAEDSKISRYIYTILFNQNSDERKLLAPSNLEDITVSISGSKANKGSSNTIKKVREQRSSESDELSASMQALKF